MDNTNNISNNNGEETQPQKKYIRTATFGKKGSKKNSFKLVEYKNDKEPNEQKTEEKILSDKEINYDENTSYLANGMAYGSKNKPFFEQHQVERNTLDEIKSISDMCSKIANYSDRFVNESIILQSVFPDDPSFFHEKFDKFLNSFRRKIEILFHQAAKLGNYDYWFIYQIEDITHKIPVKKIDESTFFEDEIHVLEKENEYLVILLPSLPSKNYKSTNTKLKSEISKIFSPTIKAKMNIWFDNKSKNHFEFIERMLDKNFCFVYSENKNCRIDADNHETNAVTDAISEFLGGDEPGNTSFSHIGVTSEILPEGTYVLITPCSGLFPSKEEAIEKIKTVLNC